MPPNSKVTATADWENRYQQGDTPWVTRQPSQELARILDEYQIPRGRALELGCGDGTNAAEEICREFAPRMQLIQLREFRFNASPIRVKPFRPLAWSALFRRPKRVTIPAV
jgi:hypothetical protein